MLSLVRRNYQLRYRQSMVGFAWAIIPSLVTVGAATLVFHKVARIDTGSTPYPLFAFAAIAPWTFFTNSLNLGTMSVIQAQSMITRLPFPREALPLAVCGTSLLDLAISILTFVGFAYVTGAGLPLTAAWLPVLLLIEIVLTVGVVLFVSALNVFVRDIRLAVPFLAQLWLFVTPVMYPLSSVPAGLRPWYRANPMTGLVESFRDVLIYGKVPDFGLLLPTIVGAIAAAIIGAWYFSATESRFADVV